MTDSATITEAMASDALAMCGKVLPDAVLHKAVLCLADYLSGAYEARSLPWSQQAIFRCRPAVEGAASIPLGGLTTAGEAAFANAVAAHGLVREDMHTGSISHLGVVVWPALLAYLAQSGRPVPGRHLLAAAVAGYEAGAVLGQALMTAELARLFRPTGLVGPVAAATAISCLRGLDAHQTATAIALAVNCAAGLNQWPASGGSDMYFHAGFAARNGLVCADLAEAGAFATPDVVEGDAGLFLAFARRPVPAPIRLWANGEYQILKVFHKQAPACNFAQTPSQAALVARNKVDGSSSAVTAIQVAATEAALLYPGCDATGPFGNMLAAKMSIQFGVAAAVARGMIDADNYADLDNAEITRLVRVTTLHADPALTAAYPQRQPARVTLRLADGRQVSGELDDVVAAGAATVRERLANSALGMLGEAQARELQTFIEALPQVADARPLNALQVPRSNH